MGFIVPNIWPEKAALKLWNMQPMVAHETRHHLPWKVPAHILEFQWRLSLSPFTVLCIREHIVLIGWQAHLGQHLQSFLLKQVYSPYGCGDKLRNMQWEEHSSLFVISQDLYTYCNLSISSPKHLCFLCHLHCLKHTQLEWSPKQHKPSPAGPSVFHQNFGSSVCPRSHPD